MMKKVLHSFGWALAVTAIVVITAFSVEHHNRELCPGTDIRIHYGRQKEAGSILLVYNDIRQAVALNFDSLKGRPNREVNPETIESVLKKINYVKDCDVMKEVNGRVHITVSQRHPVVRFYGFRGRSFYIDDQGVIMPVRFGFPARVLIVNGDIDDHFFDGENIDINSSEADSLLKDSPVKKLYEMALFIAGDDFLSKEISQIYYQKDKITLIPLVGAHTIVMETLDHYRKKLRKLEVFYKKGLKKSGWGKYKTINIEYNNQIVCTKN